MTPSKDQRHQLKQGIHHKSMQDQQMTTPDKMEVHSGMVDVLNKVTPKMMRRTQEEDKCISRVVHYVKDSKKPSLAQIIDIKSKTVCKYICQFD